MTFAVRRARAALAALLIAAGALVVSAPSAEAGPVPGYNGRIAFTRTVNSSTPVGIFSVAADGTGLEQLTDTGAVSAYRHDGASIAYDRSTGIWEMNADGTNQHELVANGHGALRMAWSPDATMFATSRSGPDGIDIIHADGSGTDTILVGSRTWYPTWSPDGTKLVYWDDTDSPGIATANLDGTNAHVVVPTPPGDVWWPSLSPDGTKFVWAQRVYDQATGTGPMRIFVAGADGSDVHAISAPGSNMPVVSPDSKWIAYGHGDSGANDAGIWVMRIDGSDARQITHGEDMFPDWQPLPSPAPRYDGKIALVRAGELYSANPDGTGLTDLHIATTSWPSWARDGLTIGARMDAGYVTAAADGTGVSTHSTTSGGFASLSPDGTKLTFSRMVSGYMDDVFVSDLDGSNEVDIVNRIGADYFPVWSPDGTKIAFTGADDTDRGIWIVNADGTGLFEVPNQPAGYGSLPRFSPDGTRLLFGNMAPGAFTTQWFTIGTDGSNLVSVGPTDRYIEDASFSPDGTRILFNSFPPGWGGNPIVRDAATGLHVMNADGSNDHQITYGTDVWAAWQPRLSIPPNLPPRALGTAQNKAAHALFANAGPSWDVDGTIVRYEWRWGDNTAMSPYRYVWHKYAQPGTYLVRLTVIDNDGAKTTIKAWVKVN